MKKRLLSVFILVAYCAVLIRVMVFKDVPTIRIGQLMLNFSGTDGGHPANFVPFTTIVPYLLGHNGWIIAGINLVGNIIFLVPIGFLLPFVFRNITWKKSLAIAFASGLAIETMQTILQVGIFDIDDVILNALGVMIGYFAFLILAKWMHERKYKNILIAAFIVIAVAAGAVYTIYPHGQPVVNPGAGGQVDNPGEGMVPTSGDLCGGTGGIGQIVTVGSNSFTIKRKDGIQLTVNLTSQATIKNSTGYESISDLKMGDSVTLVGDAHPDDSFTADAVFVCAATTSEIQSGQ